jgi:hypothetical protein
MMAGEIRFGETPVVWVQSATAKNVMLHCVTNFRLRTCEACLVEFAARQLNPRHMLPHQRPDYDYFGEVPKVYSESSLSPRYSG